jgi:predicted RNA binding protein YcfA (HicA-like mRNA interferase family)
VSKVPSLSYAEIVRALQRAGWIVVRQRGSHIRLQKRFDGELLKITVPAHRPVKPTTLARILKQARLDLDRFLDLL